MNVNIGVISSAYPTSHSSEEEKWHPGDANVMNSGFINSDPVLYFSPENTEISCNQGNFASSTIGAANAPNLTSGYDPNVSQNNTSFGSFFSNPLGLLHTNYNASPANTYIMTRSIDSCTNNAALPDTTTAAPSFAYPKSVSPMPMAFMTPSQGPTPSTTPLPLGSPLFNDSNSYQGDITDNSKNENDHVTKRHQEYAPLIDRSTQRKSVPSTSSFARGVGTIGTALSTVTGYVNQSLLLGIPFHIADHAMKESKESYAKWWEGGIGKKRKNGDELLKEARQVLGKKRRLESSESASSVGSILTVSLKQNYSEELMKIFCIGHDKTFSSSQSPPVAAVVDSSIIKRRQGVNEQKKPAYGDLETSTNQLHPNICYNAFNDIEGMYDFGETDSSDHPSSDGGHGVDKEEAFASRRSANIHTQNDAYGDQNTAQSTNSDVSGDWRNLNGTMQIIGELLEEKNRLSEESEMFHMVASPRDWVKKSIRSELIDALGSGKGDVQDKRFLSVLDILSNFYKTSGRDARVSPWSGSSGFNGGKYGYIGGESGGPTASDFFEGSWVNMTRPNYIECLGENGDNDFMYTLGRMSFDMFQPSNLICSVQSTHTTIKIIGEKEELPAFVPKSLKEEVTSLCDSENDGTSKRPLLRSYDIAVSLTIEPPSSVGQPEIPGTPTPTKRMRAVMSVKGYALPDRDTPNRLSVWFTSGQLAPAKLASNDEHDTINMDDPELSQAQANSQNAEAESDGYGGFEDWSAMFTKGTRRKTMEQRARAMAAKLLLGAELPNKMDEDGHMNYVLRRPIGGHRKVYVDVLYLDEDILVMRGHHGTIYAMARSCVSQRYVYGKFSNS